MLNESVQFSTTSEPTQEKEAPVIHLLEALGGKVGRGWSLEGVMEPVVYGFLLRQRELMHS